jgi:hypothetical protein
MLMRRNGFRDDSRGRQGMPSDPPARRRRRRSARAPFCLEPFRARVEWLEDRTLLTPDPITSAQVTSLDAGLTALANFSSDLDQLGLFADELPIVDNSLGQLFILQTALNTDLYTPASAYLAGASPTAPGLVTALNAVGDMNDGVTDTVTGTSSPYSFTFDVANFTVSTTTTASLNMGAGASESNIILNGSAPTISVTTTLAADFSFSVDDDNNFSLSVSSMTVTAVVATGNTLNFDVNFGFLGGAVQDGNVNLSAGIGVSFGGASTSITTSQLNTDAANIATNGQSNLVTLSSATDSLTAALPVEFILDGQNLSGTPTPEIDLSDSDLFSGSAPDVSTQNFANVVDFSNLTSTAVFDSLGQLGGWIQQVENSPIFGATIPFTDETVGDVIDLGAVFTDKLMTGLENIQAPETAPQVSASGGGDSGGSLTAGTYFAEYTYVKSGVESAPSPQSASFTVTAGEIPQLSFPALPVGYTMNVYLADISTGATTATLYLSNVTTTTANLSQAQGAGVPVPAGTQPTPLFATAQALANLINTETGSNIAAFDPTTDELTFTVSLSDTLAPLVLPMDLDFNLGSLVGVSTDADLLVTPTISLGFTFGIDLAPQPAVLSGGAPLPPILAGSAQATIPSDGRLDADASFQLTIDDGSPVTVTLSEADTANDTSIYDATNPDDPTTLVGQLNLALQAAGIGGQVLAGYANNNITLTLMTATSNSTLEINIPVTTNNSMVTDLGFQNGTTAKTQTATGPASDPLPSDGQLGADSSFTLTIGSNTYDISLPESVTDEDTSIVNPANPTDDTTLVGQLNLALANAGLYSTSDPSTSTVVASYQNGNIDFTLEQFGLGNSIQITFTNPDDPMATVLGFIDGDLVHTSSGGLFIENLSADTDLSVAVTTPSGSNFAAAQFGPVEIAIQQGTFCAAGDVQLQVAQDSPISLSDLLLDLASTQTLESILTVTPSLTLTGTLSGVQVSASSFLNITADPAPSLTVTALDPLGAANTLTVPSASKGELGADLYFSVTVGDDASVSIHIPQATTEDNASIAELVTEINAALSAAGVGTQVVAEQNINNPDEIDFTAVVSGTPISVNNFVTITYQNFTQLFNIGQLSIYDVIDAIASAVDGLSQYQSLGFLNDTLPFINLSVVQMVNYGAALAADVQQLQDDPSGTLQELATQLNTLLGLPAGSLQLSYDATNQALEVKFVYTPVAYDQYLGLNLNLASLAEDAGGQAATFLEGLTDLVDLSGKSRLQVAAGVTLTLDVGIGVNASGDPTAFLYNDTGITASVLVSTSDANFTATVGPLSLTIESGSAAISADGVSTTNPATFTVGIAAAAGNPSLTSFLANVTSDITTTLTAGAGISLPLYLVQGDGTQSLGTLSVTIPDLTELFQNPVPAGAVQITTPDLQQDLSQLFSLSTLLENPTIFLDPLNSLLGDLASLMGNSVLDTSLPLVGTGLSAGASFITTIQNDLLVPLDNAIKAGGSDPAQSLANAMTDALGSLLEAPVTVTNPDPNSVQFNVDLGQTQTYQVPFNLGLSALGLDLGGDVTVSLQWSFLFDFGVSLSDGLYVVTDPTDPTTGQPGPVLSLSVGVALPDTGITGSLGFLSFSALTVPAAQDVNGKNTGLTGVFTVALTPPANGDGRISASQLVAGPLSSMVSATFNADAYVDIAVVTSIGDGSMFPSFSFNFIMDWPFANWQVYGADANSNPADEGSTPQICLDNVSLQLGSFISSFVAPILKDIEPVFSAIQPVMNVLTSPIPVISDLAGQPITLITLAETLEPQYASGINAFLDVYNLFNSLFNEVNSMSGGNLSLNFGDFDLNSLIGDIRGQGSVSTASINTVDLPPVPSLSSSGAPPSTMGFLTDLDSTTPGSIEFPILNDPASIFELLMGQTVNLFLFNTPTLTLGFNYQQVFPIFGPLAATLGGNVSATIQFQFGYDTYGIQEWEHSEFALSALPDLFDGFYVVAGTPNVILNAGITAGAAVSIAVASAGVQGGIYANIDMSLVDVAGNGKDRLNDILKLLEASPLDLFDVSGSVYAQLSAYIDVDLLVYSYDKTFDITPPITLVSFNYVPPNPTVLAEQSGGTLSINTGSTSNLREYGNTNEGDQTFTVSHESGSAGNETVSVSAYGQTTTYSGVGTIDYDGGLGNDSIDMSGVLSNTILTGGEGNNTIIGGNGYNTIEESGFSSYNLSSGALEMGTNNSDTYQNIQDVVLTGQSSGDTTFTVQNYVGDDTLQGQENDNIYNVTFSPDGTTTIENTGSGDTANIVLGQGNDPVTVTPTSVSQGVNTVDFGSSVTALNIDGTASNTDYTIQDTPGSSCTTTLDTGDGNDTVDVQETSGPTIVNAGGGTDTINVGSVSPASGGSPPTSGSTVGEIAAALTVATQIGLVTLNVDDSGDSTARSATFTGTTFTGLGMGSGGITYNSLTNVNVYLGTGGVAFDIQSTQQFNTTTIYAAASGSAANTFNVGSASPGAPGQPPTPGSNLAGILGATILLGTGSDILNVDDTGDTTAQSAIVTSTTLTGLGMVTPGITYSGLSHLNVYLGTGGDTIDVPSTYSATTTTLSAQTSDSAANTFDVGSLYPYPTGTTSGGVVSNIAGPLIINGSGADTLNVDDTGDTTQRSDTTLTDTTLTGLGMGSSGITFSYLNPSQGISSLHTLSIRLGSGGNTNFTVDVDLNLPYLTTVDAGTPLDTASVTFQHNQAGVLNMIGFYISNGEVIHGNLSGLLNETEFQEVPLLTIDGSVLPTGEIIGVTIDHLIVDGTFAGTLDLTKDLGQMDVTADMSGSIDVGGNLGDLNVQGGTPGTITAATVGDIVVQGGYGPVVLQVNEAGVEHQVQADPLNDPYPQPLTVGTYPTSALLDASPAHVTFQFLYEGLTAAGASGTPLSLTSPQLTIRVTNNSGTSVPSYDLSLVTWSDVAAFNLARLDSTNGAASGIRNVSIEGSLLTQISSEAQQVMSLPASNRGGIVLPKDTLGGVAVRDYAPQDSIQAASIQAVAAGIYAQPNGRLVTGTSANYTNADDLLVPGTSIVTANSTFRVPFATQYPVAFFFGTLSTQTIFGTQDVLFTDEQAESPVTTDPRGGVTAMVTIVSSPLGGAATSVKLNDLLGVQATYESGITAVAFNGNGGSLLTGLPIAKSITSTGPLGDIDLTNGDGLTASITAPTIFGNILASTGPISGTIMTTGVETDPITGETSNIDASIGRLITTPGQNPTVTEILAGSGTFSGDIITPSNLISLVDSAGVLSGTILAEGNIGVEALNHSGVETLYGGILANGAIGGQIITKGNLLGNVTANGGMVDGRIVAEGSILGDLTIRSRFDPNSAIISGGAIGNASLGTSLAMTVSGLRGYVAAIGSIIYAPATNQPTDESFENLSPSSPGAQAIDDLFAQINEDIADLDYTALATDVYRLKDTNNALVYS